MMGRSELRAGTIQRVQVNPFSAIGFNLLAVFIYLAFGRLTDFYGSFLHLPFIFSTLCLVAVVLSGQLGFVFSHRISMALFGLTFWLVVAVPFSVWRGGSFDLVKNTWLKSIAAFVITAALVATQSDVVRGIRVLAYAFLTAALLGFVHGELTEGRFGLSTGIYSGANEYATAMVQGFVFWLFVITDPKGQVWKRGLGLLSFGPLLWILLRTGSRSGLIALAVVFAIVFLNASIRGKMAIVAVVGAGSILGIAALPTATKMRIFTLFKGGGVVEMAEGEFSEGEANSIISAAGSSTQRLDLLLSGIRLTIRHPLFGVGPGQFAVAENERATELGRKRGHWLGTHNTYVQFSSEAGIPALVFFLAAIGFAYQTLRRVERKLKNYASVEVERWKRVAFTLRLALISYIVFFVFEHIAYDPFFLQLLGMIVGFEKATASLVQATATEARPATVFPGRWQPGVVR